MKHPAVPVSDQVVPGRPARALVRVLSHAHGPVAVVPTAR
jgi:hypothetical protein